MQQTNKINKYETVVLENLTVELDGQTYKGFELVEEIVKNNKQGNYRLYNMATGGIGTMNPIGNLLAKMGIE
ncbi:MAG: hypothetical protein ACR2F1_07990 [Nitrososphaeraceae archaeon]